MAWHELLVEAWSAFEAEEYPEATRLSKEAADEIANMYGRDAVKSMGRMLRNAASEMYERKFSKCPRCDVEFLEWAEGEEFPDGAAVSRTSRAADDAPIPVCSRCGQREAVRAMSANPEEPQRWRTGEGVSGPEQWPLTIDELLAEERALYTMGRNAEMRYLTPDELDPGEEA